VDREHARFGLHQPVAGHGRGFYHRRRRSRLTIGFSSLNLVSQRAREAYRPREARRELKASAKGERRCIQQWCHGGARARRAVGTKGAAGRGGALGGGRAATAAGGTAAGPEAADTKAFGGE